MKPISSSPWLKPSIVFLISAYLFGCYSQKQYTKPFEGIMVEKPELVVVKKTNNEEVELHNAFIQNDSLKGSILGKKIGNQFYPNLKDSTSIALNDIAFIKTKNTNEGAVLFICVIAFAGIVYGLIQLNDFSQWDPSW